jgi:hypothetical protein
MTKFLAAFLASGVLLSGVAIAATPLNNRMPANSRNRTPSTPAPTHKPHSVNYNASKSNTGNRLATPAPTHKPKPHSISYNASKSNTGNGMLHLQGKTQGGLKPGIAVKGSGVPQNAVDPNSGQAVGRRIHWPRSSVASPHPTQKP